MVRRRLLLVALLLSLLAGPASPVHAGGGGRAGTILQLVAALNTGDLTEAMAHVSPACTLTLPDGTTAEGEAMRAALAALPRPITIVSVAPVSAQGSAHGGGGHIVNAVLRFSAGPETRVKFTGTGSFRLGSMIILSASGGDAAAAAARLGAAAPAPQSPPNLPSTGSGGLLSR